MAAVNGKIAITGPIAVSMTAIVTACPINMIDARTIPAVIDRNQATGDTAPSRDVSPRGNPETLSK